MRSNAIAKIKSARKWTLPALAILLIAGWFLWQAVFPTTTVTINSRVFKVTVVDTVQSRAQGLSGRSGLSADEGMLFDFARPDRTCFWMKDMQFPIDMIWIDAQGRVTHTERNVLPETFPNKYCGDGQYVLEVSAGTVADIDLQTGQVVHF